LAACLGGGDYGFSYSKEQSDFNLVKKVDSERDYYEFLSKYPDGFFADAAEDLKRRLIDTDIKIWAEAFTAKSLSKCQLYIDEFGSKKGCYLGSTIGLLDSLHSLDFEKAITLNTPEAYEYYLTNILQAASLRKQISTLT
jgi:hypothetical protein